MEIKDIYKPIEKKIAKMEDELNKLLDDESLFYVRDLVGYFFENPGKWLRPALVFLAAGTVENKQKNMKEEQLIQLALAIELLHSASLIHDDIIDEDSIRRQKKTLNNRFGNKLAVLAGDTLFSCAYALTSNLLSREHSQALAELSLNMCVAEIEQANGDLDHEKYLKVIAGKTAFFMSVCCKLGATLAGATEKEIKSLESFGLNFGMVYQIKDDYMDGEYNALSNTALEELNEFAHKGKQALNELEDSDYKKHLYELMDYVIR